MTRKLRCIVQYDGSGFAGFQRQRGQLTVQQALEEAIFKVTRQQVTVVGAGRTDAGVHAHGQVAHFELTSELPCATLLRAVNACLPPSIALLALDPVSSTFHARHDAVSREYRYVVDNAAVRSPLLQLRAFHVSGALNLEAMQHGAALLCGRHDFGAFGSPMLHTSVDPETRAVTQSPGSTVRTMLGARCWRRHRFFLFCFIADAFLRHMVRMLVGTLLRIGTGRLPATVVTDLLNGESTVHAGPAAPAHGLYLMRVRYA